MFMYLSPGQASLLVNSIHLLDSSSHKRSVIGLSLEAVMNPKDSLQGDGDHIAFWGLSISPRNQLSSFLLDGDNLRSSSVEVTQWWWEKSPQNPCWIPQGSISQLYVFLTAIPKLSRLLLLSWWQIKGSCLSFKMKMCCYLRDENDPDGINGMIRL